MQGWLAKPGFHLLTHVAKGCRVVYSSTVCKATGATNSALGTVQDVLLGPPPPGEDPSEPWVQALKVKLDLGGRVVTVSRTVQYTTRRHDRSYTKATFPLLLGYAITAHRAQGATLTGRTILDVRSAFAPGIVYVMLSRVTSRDDLFILGDLQPNHFVPVATATFAGEATTQQQDSGDSSSDGQVDTSADDSD
jgi:hypothetical protein